ncbi:MULTISPECIES: hypothetical protein [Pseudomonas]|uniref:hypothetical protein n=1 Tax=Pseudomonas TaxID=286 RepID=UPI001F2F4D67|nr:MULTISPECIES: hypothetical protein [Pseudomonas]MCF3155695.1 hypothetical protein [Pseudomonas juntendi]MCQ1993094.1 hypothetical protein [Pseudomonas sp. Eb3]MDQ2487624.1 hypothetical protein [Pseudomonas putida]UJW21912.1 hypothetical protein L2Y89_23840 [Pseudomonas juntendi]
MQQALVELAKYAGSALLGSLTTIFIFVWKERNNKRRESRENYSEAIAAIQEARDSSRVLIASVDGSIQQVNGRYAHQELHHIIRKILKLRDTDIKSNMEIAEDLHDELYRHTGHIALEKSQNYLKRARAIASEAKVANQAASELLADMEKITSRLSGKHN